MHHALASDEDSVPITDITAISSLPRSGSTLFAALPRAQPAV
ncbi:hypothetical protein [Mycobacterium malmoense]|nr:hypothetical protein [Mycobacterium malmoense]